MAIDRKFTYIDFSRMKDLLDFPLPEKLREITYVANCTNFRRMLLNKYGRPDIDIDKEIVNNTDTKLTYLGYRKFLESDLKHIFTLGENRGSNQYKRDVKYLAKQMLIRGYVSYICPNYPHAVKGYWKLIAGIGFCWSCQERVSKSPEIVNTRIYRGTQSIHEPFGHQDWIYYTMALQRSHAGQWRVGKRSHGRVSER
jgi:hypothetical protein